MRRAPAVRLHWEQRRQLLAVARGRSTHPKVALRAEIILRASSEEQNSEIASALGIDTGTVGRWRRRFLLQGVAGITREAPRSGRPPLISAAKVEEVVHSTVDGGPPAGDRPSARKLAQQLGMSKSSVQRIWKARGIGAQAPAAPERIDSGVDFLGRVTDLVGLYLNPPERAVAFSTDDRARPHALRRGGRETPPPVPRRSRGAEFRAFLQVTDRETPPGLHVHLLIESRFGPTPPEVDRWLSQHPRFHLHFLPSDPVGLTLIDRLIEGFSRRKDRPGASASAHRLKYAIREYLLSHRASLQPFVWTATSEEIRGPYGRITIRG